MTMRKNSAALWLLVGDGFSAFGTWIDFLAILTLAVYLYHVTPYEMALVSAVGLLPGMLAASRIGKLCDRANPKQLLLFSIVFRVVATGGILFCGEFVLFLALVAVRSLFTTVAGPAINVMAMRAVDAPERPKFYSLLNVVNNTAKIIAPAIGTVSSSLASESVALLLSAVFSATAFVAFACVRLKPLAAQEQGTGSHSGVDAALPNLLPLVWIAATYACSVFMVNNLFPLVLQQAGMDKSLLGVLVSCSGAGNILSGLWLARRPANAEFKGKLAEVIAPALGQAAGFGVIGIVLWADTPHTALVLPLIFLVGGTVSARFAVALNVYMSTHYAATMGRVSGTVQAWQNGMIFLAPLLGALVLDRLGGPALFAFATASSIVSFAAFGFAKATLKTQSRAALAVD